MPVAKQIKGSDFYRCISYLLDREEKEIIESNLSGKTAIALSKRFELCCQLNGRMRKPVYHATISFNPNEGELDNRKLRAISYDYLYGMGFGEEEPDLDKLEKEKRKGEGRMFGRESLAVPYVVVKHDDTEHQHIHIVAGRVRHDGSCVSSYWDYRKSERVLRMLENYHGLSSPEGTEVLQELRDILDRSKEQCKDFQELDLALNQEGVKVYKKKSGIVYGYKNSHYKGNTLGAKYTLQGMSKVLDIKGLEDYQTTTPSFEFDDEFIKRLEQYRNTMEQLLKNQDTESYKGDYYAIERSKKSLVVSKVDNSDEMIKWIKPAPNKPWILNNFRFTRDTYDDFEEKTIGVKNTLEVQEKERIKQLEAVEKQQEIQKKLMEQIPSSQSASGTITTNSGTNRRRRGR
ncbi:relaxase (plasmid) [Cyanobacterium sp. HL-69]|uniref:relaxase/mobilization nuclease domain-containing protein n=1 Tax=Cyanobacterium sp. HL-69 TaxID=2054282 RepID=UPI000CA33A61|nr:relaxase [Cyanobacterium sp. HL-69]